MSSETKSRAGRDWATDLDDLCTTMAYHTLPFKDRVEAFERFLSRYREALESSSSADTGGREALSGMLAERMIKLAIKIQGPYAPFGPPESLARRKKSHEERIEELTGMLTAEFAECLEAVPARGAAPGTTRAEGLRLTEQQHEELIRAAHTLGDFTLHTDHRARELILLVESHMEAAATQRAPVTTPGRDEVVIDALNDHWPTWIEGASFVEALGVCACGKAKADGVRPYKTIWSEHMGELVREALAAAKEPRG